MRDARNVNIFKTPLGWAGVAVSEKGICKVVLPKKEKKAVEKELKRTAFALAPDPSTKLGAGLSLGGRGSRKMLEKTIILLGKYFSGECVSFDLPLDMRYYTAFQQAVWRAAAEIPHGETRAYSWIAKRIKNPKAVRAVGQALGANPFPVMIPCHRVIDAAGTTGGFSGGLGMKKKLLALETESK